MEESESDIKQANRWKEVVSQFRSSSAFYDRPEKEYIYPGDEEIIREFNDKHSPKQQFVLNTIPYPWLGNPLKAKVIILSQNPGWVENSGMVVPLMLQQITDAANKLLDFYKATYSLESEAFMPDNNEIKTLGFSTRDAFNIMGDWYWKKRFHFLADEGIPEDIIYKNVAVIQYIPYSSVEYAPLPKGVTLPSQIFTRRLIEYISRNHKDTIFIVPRAKALWENFLVGTWENLAKKERIITHRENTYRSQYISPKCLVDGGFDRIVKILRGEALDESN